ncbi:MAG: N(4)-(beta-N-acetylglucosaminyl)-L-asparaginase [Saprospiraceae bacterium]
MQKRRTFLSSAIVGFGTMSLADDILDFFREEQKVQKPLIIATWKNIKAVEAAWDVLKHGGSALDAVEAGARVPEADPLDTSVGYGGFPDREGKVTLDACIMDENGNAGSVVFLEEIMHAVSVARLVMEKTPHVILAGAGAKKFALEHGFKQENLLTEHAKTEYKKWLIESKYEPKINVERHDTIGILAMDNSSNLSGACTTSGLAFKMHGRVGDSPIIGAGLYVDNEVGAATATGLGEAVIKKVGAFSIVEMMRHGMHPDKACKAAVKRLLTIKTKDEFQVGYIAVNKKGELGACSLRPGFEASVITENGFQLIKAQSFFK